MHAPYTGEKMAFNPKQDQPENFNANYSKLYRYIWSQKTKTLIKLPCT